MWCVQQFYDMAACALRTGLVVLCRGDLSCGLRRFREHERPLQFKSSYGELHIQLALSKLHINLLLELHFRSGCMAVRALDSPSKHW